MVNYRYPETHLDRQIHGLMDELMQHLPCMWYIAPEQMNLFGRVYRNPKPNGGFIPEFYAGDSEYKDTLLDDRFAAVAFFGIDDTTTAAVGENSSNMHCVFFVHLGRLRFRDKDGAPQILAGRGDLEARNAVQAVLGQNEYGLTLTSVVTGPRALQEYDIARPMTGNSSEMNRWDMHPWHVFRVNGTMRWDAPNINNYNKNN